MAFIPDEASECYQEIIFKHGYAGCFLKVTKKVRDSNTEN